MISSGGSLLVRGAGFHRETMRNTARKEPALIKKTAHGPDAATIKPPIAGPIARAMLMATQLSESAGGKSLGGTKSGVIACQTGLLTAEPIPSRKVSESRR